MLSKFYGLRPQGGGSFETFSWYYLRISGFLLLFLVIIHLIITHVTTDVACTTFAFVNGRYANPFWKLFDWLLLTIALTHGMNGLRIVIDDYVRGPRARLVAQSIVAVLLVATFMLGTITLVAFQPVAPALQGPACVSPGH